MTFRTITFPLVVAVPAVAGMLLPVASHGDLRVAAGSVGIFIAWWSSIVLASLPYVTAGAVCAHALERLAKAPPFFAIVAMIAPGCDCAGAGYAYAFVRQPPALAAFALVWSAAAGPAALFATYNALGPHLLVARIVGAFAASTLTALLWAVDRRRTETNASMRRGHSCRTSAVYPVPPLRDRVTTALGALAVSALSATTVLVVFGHFAASSSPFVAAASGALMSPCSTSDAVIARVLVHRPASQIAFVLASQTIDVRQLATFARVFGARRAALAAVAGAAGCSIGALCAR